MFQCLAVRFSAIELMGTQCYTALFVNRLLLSDNKGGRGCQSPRISQMQLDLFNSTYDLRCAWMGWFAILHLQLEHAWAVEHQDFWHISLYKNAIKGALNHD